MAGGPATLTLSPTPVTKLRPPRARHAEVTRVSLLDQTRVRNAEVLAIVAPAGYGKSTFASQWAARSEQPVAWLTCDETDSDAIVLLSGLAAALASSGTAYTAPPGPVTVDEPAFTRSVLPAFMQSVSSIRPPVTIVIDEVQLVKGVQARFVLKAFINALPAGSQIAIVGRSLQGLPLPLWRGQGRVADVTAEDLAFGVAETREALEDLTRARVADHQVARVVEATQGWPVAVYLMSQADAPDRQIPSITELIETEVLKPMPPRLRKFVVTTAALGHVNTELAREVTGEDRAAQYLGETITTVLMHNVGGWYRYHPLMQECATDLLAREDPEHLRQMHSRAALWYMDQGYPDPAVRHALASRDQQALAVVIWPAARTSLLQGRVTAVEDWYETLGDKTVLAVPSLALTAAWTNVTSGDYGQALRYLDAVLTRMPAGWREDFQLSDIASEVAMLLAVSGYALSGPDAAAELAGAAVAHLDASDPVQPLAALIWGLNLTLIGDARAEQVLHRAVLTARAVGISSSEIEALSLLALLQMANGDEAAGCQSVELANSVYAYHDLTAMTSTTGILALGRVALTTCRGTDHDLSAAIAELNRIRPDIEPLFPWYRGLAGGVLALASVRRGDFARYREYLSWCEESEAPAEATCRRWAARARQEFTAASPLSTLSPAELRVWELLKSRMTLSEIGEALFLSRETVKTHTVAIYRKLRVSSRREAQELADSWSSGQQAG